VIIVKKFFKQHIVIIIKTLSQMGIITAKAALDFYLLEKNIEKQKLKTVRVFMIGASKMEKMILLSGGTMN
jgi:hypothetical protein